MRKITLNPCKDAHQDHILVDLGGEITEFRAEKKNFQNLETIYRINNVLESNGQDPLTEEEIEYLLAANVPKKTNGGIWSYLNRYSNRFIKNYKLSQEIYNVCNRSPQMANPPSDNQTEPKKDPNWEEAYQKGYQEGQTDAYKSASSTIIGLMKIKNES